MTPKSGMLTVSLVVLTGCVNFAGITPFSSAERSLTLQEMLSCVVQAPQASSSASAPQSALPGSAGPEGRFLQACALGHEGASDAQLQRAQALLDGLEDELRLEGGAQVVTLFRKQMQLTQHLREQRRLVREYRLKIEQLKGLERELEAEPPTSEALP